MLDILCQLTDRWLFSEQWGRVYNLFIYNSTSFRLFPPALRIYANRLTEEIYAFFRSNVKNENTSIVALVLSEEKSQAVLEKRMRGIEVCRNLTDEWKKRGVQGEGEYSNRGRG
jgi:hypothetical protein